MVAGAAITNSARRLCTAGFFVLDIASPGSVFCYQYVDRWRVGFGVDAQPDEFPPETF